MLLAAVLVFVVAFVVDVTGHSGGAPSGACETLTPQHGGQPQTSTAPYTVTPSAAQVAGGSRITVRLEAPTIPFAGFLLQGRTSTGDDAIGTFYTTQYKYLSCNGLNNAVTHRSSGSKRSVVLEWEAPSDYTGDVVFVATFVRDYNTFWVKVHSEKVTVTADGDASTSHQETHNTESTAASVTSPVSLNIDHLQPEHAGEVAISIVDAPVAPPSRSLVSAMESIYQGCEKTKGCFGYPSGCEKKENCAALMTYTKMSPDYQFELMGRASDGYVAGGLSLNDKMGSDSVMVCRILDGVLDVHMAWNEGKTNNLLADDKIYLSNIEMAEVDGTVYCRFNRQANTQINNVVFDLNNKEYYLLVARGPMHPSGVLSYHVDGYKLASGESKSLSDFSSTGAASELFKLLHACFMIGAWIGAASCGILIARYYKQTWMKSRCCNIDMWFHLHRSFMILTWCLTIAGLVLIALYIGGITEIDQRENPHAIIGIVSIGLCFIQPFMAMCRPHPNEKRRPIFNWLHWFVGNSAQILGIAAIFFGMQLYGLPLWTWWILIIFIAFHCLVHLILSVGQCIGDSSSKHRSDVFPMKDLAGSQTPLHPADVRQDAPGSAFRKVMLALYLLGNWVITAVLIFIVVVGEEQLDNWGLIFWK